MAAKDFKHQSCRWPGYIVAVVLSENCEASCRVYIYDDEPAVAIISDLYVAEESRRKGLATEIIRYCEKIALSEGCDEISLRSDNDDWVRQWYKRLGFEEESSQVWFKKSI